MLPTQWTYGDGGWPDNGEIDIMEHVGYDPGVVHGAIHTRAYNHAIGTHKAGTVPVPDATDAFHIYALEWFPDRLEVSVDNATYFTFANEETGWQAWPYDKEFHFVLNIAVGGNWGGTEGVDSTIWPQRLAVDYIRVYQLMK